VQGGAIVGRSGWNPLAAGRREWLAQWAFWNLNIPTLLTVSGHAVADAGASVWLADDVFVVGLSMAYDEDGLEQVLDTVRLSAGGDELQVLTIRCQGNRWFDRDIGVAAHVTNLLAPLGERLALCHPAGIDTASLLWLRRSGYRLVEADPDDQVRHRVCNIVLLEPGRVIMPAGADRTIARVREAGVEVLEVAASSLTQAGGGLRAATMEIYREPSAGVGSRGGGGTS
jgi:N-dimethylarginine dimethylaminohydrolase